MLLDENVCGYGIIESSGFLVPVISVLSDQVTIVYSKSHSIP